MNTADTIRRILAEKFQPTVLEIDDDSAAHAGHAGARQSGGGHFAVRIESERFRGLGLVEQHRLVNEALKDLLGGGKIHALAITTRIPAKG